MADNDFWSVIEQAEKEVGGDGTGASEPAEATSVAGPAHIGGALKHTAIQWGRSLGAPLGTLGDIFPGQDNFASEAWKTHKAYYDKLIKEDPDVQDWSKAVEKGEEPFVSEWMGSLGPTAAALQFAAVPGTLAKFGVKGITAAGELVPKFTLTVGKILSASAFYKLNQEEIYDMAMAEGADEKSAKVASLVGGSLSTLGDIVGLEGVLRTFRGKALNSLLISIGIASIAEGTTEGMQGAIGYISKEWAKGQSQGETVGKFSERMILERDKIWEAAKHDAMIGGASGLFFGVGGAAGSAALRSRKPIEEVKEEGGEAQPVTSPTVTPTEGAEPAVGGIDALRPRAGETDEQWHERIIQDMRNQMRLERARADETGRWDEELKKEEEAIEGAAALEIRQRLLGGDRVFRLRQESIEREKKQLKLIQDVWRQAVEDGREPTNRLVKMHGESSAKLRALEKQQSETRQEWHDRIVADMRRELEYDQWSADVTFRKTAGPARVIDAEPLPEGKTYVGGEGNYLLDTATKMVGGTPGVAEVVPGGVGLERLNQSFERGEGGLIDAPNEAANEIIKIPGSYAGAREVVALREQNARPVPPIVYSKGTKISGVDALSRQPDQRYLVGTIGRGGEVVAKEWRISPGDLGRGEVAIDMVPTPQDLTKALPEGQRLSKIEVGLEGKKMQADEAIHTVDKQLEILRRLSDCINP